MGTVVGHSVCLAALLACFSASAAPACEVMAVRGQATAAGRVLAQGDKLDEGTVLKTGAQGRVRLRCGDGSTLVLGDNSSLTLEKFEVGPDDKRIAAKLLLESGLLGQKVAASTAGSWEVRTPTAVTAVRGTEFVVEVNAEQLTEVNVQSGQVDVEALLVPTRALHPRKPSRVSLDSPKAGTKCSQFTGCTESVAWSAERIKSTQDRLSFD